MVLKWRQRFKGGLAAKPATSVGASCEVEVDVGKRRVRIRGVSIEFAEKFLLECLK